MVETERAFSRTSEEKGTRESFAEFIAEDGILFRPTAVLGKKWMQEHPLPPSTTRPLLSWQPIFAAVSRAGDLGYTTGPWQFKQDIKDAKPAAFGNFMTVWKKQADGTWKFALDLGISNPEPKATTPMWEPDNSQTGTGSFKRIDPEACASRAVECRSRILEESLPIKAHAKPFSRTPQKMSACFATTIFLLWARWPRLTLWRP